MGLLGFFVLAIWMLSFEEPERGRFDISHSVLVNPNLSFKAGSVTKSAYSISVNSRLNIEKRSSLPSSSRLWNYLKAVKEIFSNDCAIWILIAACLRT